MRFKIFIILLFLIIEIIFVNITFAKEAEVYFVDIEGHSRHDLEEIASVCDLLGVRFKTHYLRTTNDAELLKSSRELHGKEVLILTQKVMKYFTKDMTSLLGESKRKTKILILDINSDTEMADLKIWSDNKINGFRQFDLQHRSTSISVAKNDEISKELGGMEYTFISSGPNVINGFELTGHDRAVSLIEVADKAGKQKCPIYAKTESENKSVFFLTSWEKIISADTDVFIKIAPVLMFLKYSFGDRCWHGVHDHANFTIDDPWLREPFGYISFKDLCREAEKARFHVSIGFIPYNYLKSNNEAIEIFRQCAKALSIAIHGNNHDLSEFRVSRNGRSTDGKSNSVHPDEKNILQALYRMDTFSRKTGLSYDRVMIFPRGVFTQESLGLLKRQNFLMTVTGAKPLNTRHMTSGIDRMRGITLEYDNFPMVLRSGISDWKKDKHAEALEKRSVQMRLFLDLPVLLYAHHDFFKEGADTFNSVAGMINQTQPAVVWSSLGSIAKKLYLQKRIDDREIEIVAFSNDLVINNHYNAPIKYVVRKQENFLTPIQSVEVDGIKHEYLRDGNHIRIEVLIEQGSEKNVRILYHSEYRIGSFTYSDDNLQATLIRTLADFRDLFLSKLPFGDRMIVILYRIGGVKSFVIFLIGLMGICLILFVWHMKKRRSKGRRSVLI